MKCPKCKGVDSKKIYETTNTSWSSVFAAFTTIIGVVLIVLSMFGWASAIIAISMVGLGLLWMKLAEKKDDKKFGQKWFCNSCNYSFKVKG